MSVLGVRTEKSGIVDRYMTETHDRLQNPNLISNPFNGGVKKIEEGLYVIVSDPVYFPFYWIGLGIFVLTFLFTGLSWFTFPGAVLFSLGFFWSKYFIFVGVFVGLRKYKYEGKIKMVSNADIIRRMHNFHR